MALKRISDYPLLTPLVGTELVEVETSGGLSRKVTAQGIADLGSGGGGGGPFVGCRAVASTSQSIANAVSGGAALIFDTEDYDTDAIHSTVTNTSRFTIPAGKGGNWRICYKASCQSGGAEKIFFLVKNGLGNLIGSAVNSNETSRTSMYGEMVVVLAAGDYIEARAFQASGSAQNWGSASAGDGFENWVEMELLTAPSSSPSVVPVSIQLAASDEGTVLTTGTKKVTFRLPYAMTLTGIRASLTTAASTGLSTFDVNMNGTSILSTRITIDATEKSSTTAAIAPVISTTALTDDAEITVDIDGIGAGATGLKITLIGTKP